MDIILEDKGEIGQIFNFKIDVCDSMGANKIIHILEGLKPMVIKMFKCEVLLCILSNLCPERIVHSHFEVPVEALKMKKFTGLQVAEKIVKANKFATKDIFRATTHNKGIMNGIDAVAFAVGQDTRAIEASCHAFSFYKFGKYRALTDYTIFSKKGKKFLRGELELPFVVGIKGGVINSNPMY